MAGQWYRQGSKTQLSTGTTRAAQVREPGWTATVCGGWAAATPGDRAVSPHREAHPAALDLLNLQEKPTIRTVA